MFESPVLLQWSSRHYFNTRRQFVSIGVRSFRSNRRTGSRRIESRQGRMVGMSESLLCEEEIGAFSPWKDEVDFGFEGTAIDFSSPFLEDDGLVRVLMAKELSFMPGDDYCCRLESADLRGTRCRAVRWMLKASGHFNFSPHTVSSAVNCLDRFLARSLDKPWKAWMTDLLAVGCLSVAAKQDEVHVPLLQDLQVEGVEYMFNSATLQRMEVTILNRMEWRLRSVTAFSYTDAVLPYLNVPPILKTFLRARVTELLLQTLSESQFVEYRPSIVALSSIYCALEELLPTKADLLKSNLCNIIPVDKKSHLWENFSKSLEDVTKSWKKWW